MLSLLFAVALAAPPAVPAPVAAHVRLGLYASGLAEPVAMAVAPGDPARRIFIAEKGGHVRVIKGGRVLPRAYLDVSHLVSDGMEQGLLGIAFSPDFAMSRHFYIHYTDRHGDIRIVRYTQSGSDADRADAGSAAPLYTVPHHRFRNHNGGNLVFGPDGALWVGTGDGGGANDPLGNAQNPGSILGKMLHFDLAAGGAPEVVMRGLRNPWRYSFDRKTGDLYIGDVGQDRWEEVDVLAPGQLRGANLGWNILEGNHCLHGDNCDRNGFVMPVVEYGHERGSCSIIGGYVYRGKAIPQLSGTYFYADWCNPFLRSFKWAGGTAAREQYEWRHALDTDRKLAQVTSFGQDADGELYILCQTGNIYKFQRTP